jgi:hypothetical protein
VPDLDVHRGGKHPQEISEFQETTTALHYKAQKKQKCAAGVEGGGGPYGLVHVAVELVDGVVEGDEIGQGDDLQAVRATRFSKNWLETRHGLKLGMDGVGWVCLVAVVEAPHHGEAAVLAAAHQRHHLHLRLRLRPPRSSRLCSLGLTRNAERVVPWSIHLRLEPWNVISLRFWGLMENDGDDMWARLAVREAKQILYPT